MAGVLVIAIFGSGASGGQSERLVDSPTAQGVHRADRAGYPRVSDPPRSECPHAKRGLRFYVRRYGEHAARMGVGAQVGGAQERGRPNRIRSACPLYLANVWKRKSFAMRMRVERFISTRTLRDFAFRDGNHAWHKAVREVQRVFPGTESWLLSCSAAEGGHGRWVGYSGVSYSTWLRDSDTVGGPLQFRFSTFTGMYRRATDYVVSRGYRVPRMDSTTAWRSALGQALAGGWARYTGNDNSHWSASFGRGC